MSTVRARLAAFSRFDALVLTSLLWFLGKFVRYAFPPLFDTFRAQYGISPAALGLLYSGLMVAYAAMQFPSGAIADAFGPTRVIVGGAVITAGAAALLGAVQAVPVLVLAMVLIGLGTGLHKTVAIDLLATVYPHRTGRTLGVMDAIGGMAGVAAPTAVVIVLAAAVGWPTLFLGAGAAGVALVLAFALRVPRHVPEAAGGGRAGIGGIPGARTVTARYFAAVAEPRVLLLVGVVTAFAFAWNGVLAFLPLYLTAEKAFTTGQAGVLYAVLFLASLVQPLTGVAADRAGRRPVMLLTTALAGVGIVLLTLTGDPVGIAVLVAVIGLGGHGFRPARDARLVAVIPDAVTGGTLGLVRTGMMAVGAAAPAVVGIVSETAGFDLAFGVLAGAIGVSVLFLSVSAVGSDGR